MIWFIAEDIFYYELVQNIHGGDEIEYGDEIKNDWKNHFSKYDKIIIMPTIKDIKENVGLNNTAFISSDTPPQEFANIFIEKKLNNLHGVLTSQEIANKVSVEESLKKKLGLRTTLPTLNFSNLGGFYEFKKWARVVDLSKSKGLSVKPVLLVGFPGVGKSFGAACYAGEYGMPLVELSLSVIKEKKDPVTALNRVFEYTSSLNQEVVFLIDEIEQAIHGKSSDLLGALLTIFNDLNTEIGYKLDGMLFATSNNISEITLQAPQFLRAGRWSEKFFVNYATRSEAIDIMKLYRDTYKLDNVLFGAAMMVFMYVYSSELYKDDNIDETRSVYSNSEIKYLFEKISLYSVEIVDIKGIEDLAKAKIREVLPLQKTSHAGLHRLFNDAKNNQFAVM